jgi:hypothetical protein
MLSREKSALKIVSKVSPLFDEAEENTIVEDQ